MKKKVKRVQVGFLPHQYADIKSVADRLGVSMAYAVGWLALLGATFSNNIYDKKSNPKESRG